MASKHIGESYVLGARAPKDNPLWRGPWDCAEFASWLVWQASGELFGCTNNEDAPSLADAFTGSWGRDANDRRCIVDIDHAARTAGAFVLRLPHPEGVGHVVVSDGHGGTVEAHSSKRGVIRDTLQRRRWDYGILPPMLRYTGGRPLPPIVPPRKTILRLTRPNTEGPLVLSLQRALRKHGIHPGPLDGVYGPMTMAAVKALQLLKGLVVDGEAGAAVAKALGIAWH